MRAAWQASRRVQKATRKVQKATVEHMKRAAGFIPALFARRDRLHRRVQIPGQGERHHFAVPVSSPYAGGRRG